MIKTLFVFGTRPEAIKLCPVVSHLRSIPALFHVEVCVTAQHRAMLDQVLDVFGVQPDYDLDLMQPGQTLSQSTSRIVASLEPVMRASRPDIVVVQGDTTTTLCGALSAFYHQVAVGHVEAGLRTGDLLQPFPEELNRVLTSRISALHFAATEGAARNLRAEGISAGIVVTGNSGIDAVMWIRDRLAAGEAVPGQWSEIPSGKKMILVTAHRRESFGPAFESICMGLARIAQRPDVHIVYPVHRNPNVMDPVSRLLGDLPNVTLLEPLDYVPFIDLMQRACLVITDSGGVQEEGPSLGKPILVMREKTERPEAVEAGTVRLVGTDARRIFEEASLLLDNPEECARMSRVHNPYGDGRASERIAGAIHSFITEKGT
ncbi:MAG: UDP-N-Acetylglucosamine 2-epimerase [Bryobacterales bacterium]|nr:UDP-N-Acetylglucosamine 2-epimerase [Bryobacterales bacterium]